MILHEHIRLQINCQKGKQIETELSINTGVFEQDGIQSSITERAVDGCQLGMLSLKIENDPMGENANLTAEAPIRVYIPVSEQPEKMTAMYLFGPWWTRPAFVDRLRDIPPLTQAAFFQYKDRFTCFVPMVGQTFKTYLTSGTETELCLEMTARMGGQCQVDEPIYLFAEGATVAEAVHKAFTYITKAKGILPREDRRYPEMFRYLGWCSWDAFRTDITEEQVRQKAEELTAKQVPVRWMILDDGWLSVENKRLTAFEPDREKFPNGFRTMIDDIRSAGAIRWFGVWHALGGYWNGIAPGSALARNEAHNLIQTANGTIVPSPKTGSGFYHDWYKLLRQEGIEFVKVDGQSATAFYFQDTLPLSEAARGINEALEQGACRLDGAIINCMGMAMENVLARPTSAISRSSNDFLPDEKESFAEHLLENAYNSIYHNEIYACDWDMFWTKHEDAGKHALLRAISGGPVYFSDRIGDTIPEILKPLAYHNGRILMMDHSARPTEDCIFSDPLKDGVLKLHNTAPWGSQKGGGIAGYNLTEQAQTFSFTPEDVQGLSEAEQYWVYDFFQKKVSTLRRGEQFHGELPAGGFAWYVILPRNKDNACLGLLDKYVGFTAVENVQVSGGAEIVVLHESGTIGWASEKRPLKVLYGTEDWTERIQEDGSLYTLPLPDAAEKAILTITWK